MTAKHPEPGITTPQLGRVTGADARNLAYWLRTDLIRPSVRRAKGRGRAGHLWSLRDAVAVKAIVDLRAQGISLQQVRKVASYLRRRRGWESLASARLLVTAEGDVKVATFGQEESVLKRPGQFYFSYALGEACERIVRELAEAA